MLIEPQPTQYDLKFRVGPYPVRVHPLFWLVGAIFGWRGAGGDILLLSIWVAVLFVSILVHELGHAVVIRHFGWKPRVWLYSFGGLAVYDPGYGRGPKPKEQFLISLAGPAAGFLLAGLVVGLLFLQSRSMWFLWFRIGVGAPIEAELPRVLVGDLLYVNILWGLVNLLPVFPLDGGQAARAVLVAQSGQAGIVASLKLSVLAGGAVAVFALFKDQFYIAILFGLLAFNSFQMLQAMTGRGGGGYGGPPQRW